MKNETKSSLLIEGKERKVMAPKVSVMVITYNQVEFIKDTIDSVLQQDYPNFEFVIADDGSTDGTAEIINEYARNHPEKICAITGQANLGITGNSNRGLKACTGKYIAIMGGDDLFLPGKLTAQVKWLEQDENRILCYHDMEVFDSATDTTLYYQSRNDKFYEGEASKIIEHGAFFGGSTVMFRTSKPLILFDENIPVSSDWLYWFEVVASQRGKFGFIDGVYTRYRKHSKNITATSNHGEIESFLTLDIIERKYPEYERIVKNKYTFLALYYCYSSFRKVKIKKGFGFLKRTRFSPFRLYKAFRALCAVAKYRNNNKYNLTSRYPKC